MSGKKRKAESSDDDSSDDDVPLAQVQKKQKMASGKAKAKGKKKAPAKKKKTPAKKKKTPAKKKKSPAKKKKTPPKGKGKAKAKAKPKAKPKGKGKAKAKPTPPKKAAKKKTPAKKSSGGGSSGRGAGAEAYDAGVARATNVFTKSTYIRKLDKVNKSNLKEQLAQCVLRRWWYCFDWPRPESLESPGPSYMSCGFPGVWVCVMGDDLGHIVDRRNRKGCPSRDDMLKESSAKLAAWWRAGMQKQRAELVQFEGNEAPLLVHLDLEIAEAKKWTAANSTAADAAWTKKKKALKKKKR